MTIEEITAAAARIANELARIALLLDGNIYAMDDVRKRGAFSRLQRHCHDAACHMSGGR